MKMFWNLNYNSCFFSFHTFCIYLSVLLSVSLSLSIYLSQKINQFPTFSSNATSLSHTFLFGLIRKIGHVREEMREGQGGEERVVINEKGREYRKLSLSLSLSLSLVANEKAMNWLLGNKGKKGSDLVSVSPVSHILQKWIEATRGKEGENTSLSSPPPPSPPNSEFGLVHLLRTRRWGWSTFRAGRGFDTQSGK